MALIPGLPDEIARECLIRVPRENFSTILAVCRCWKEEVESSKFHHQRKARGFAQAIFLLNQSDPHLESNIAFRLTLYEPGTGVWNKLPNIPGLPEGLIFCRYARVGRNLVVIGGQNPVTGENLKSVFIYDFVYATWRRGTNMPGESRLFFACASDSDRMVFVAGGRDEGENMLKSAIKYDVEKDEWVSLPDMARQRYECQGIFHRGKFRVFYEDGTEMEGFVRDAEVFDTTTCAWEDQVVDDLLGIYRCRNFDSLEVLIRDGMWKPIAKLPDDAWVAPFIVTCLENLLVIGSATQRGPNRVYKFETKHYTWTQVEVQVPEEYSGHVVAVCCLEI